MQHFIMTMATTIVCARYTVMLHVTQIKPPHTGYVVTYRAPLRRVASCSFRAIYHGWTNKPLARSHPSHKTHVKVVDFEKSRVAKERGITPPCAVNSARFIRANSLRCSKGRGAYVTIKVALAACIRQGIPEPTSRMSNYYRIHEEAGCQW